MNDKRTQILKQVSVTPNGNYNSTIRNKTMRMSTAEEAFFPAEMRARCPFPADIGWPSSGHTITRRWPADGFSSGNHRIRWSVGGIGRVPRILKRSISLAASWPSRGCGDEKWFCSLRAFNGNYMLVVTRNRMVVGSNIVLRVLRSRKLWIASFVTSLHRKNIIYVCCLLNIRHVK